MNFFFKPRPGVIGDTIPYYHDGRYHVFYLRDNRDRDSYGIGSAWEHISTTDFIHWDDHGVALEKGTISEQDHTVATGSVFTDAEGKHHIFYTGINPYLRTDTAHEQALLHATSDDLVHWTKHPEQVWYADETIYERHDWRDPFVFVHPTNGRYYMILAARLKSGAMPHRGCTALLTSRDLASWVVEKQPFYAPMRYHGHECPDWFKMGDKYYLVFSEYTTHTVTRYVSSDLPDSGWIAHDDNQFDNRAFYAAKTASDGTRRFIFGWNPSKQGDVDHGEWQWGGCLTVHEIVQRVDGTLAVKPPPEIEAAFGDLDPIRLSLSPAWSQTEDGYAAQCLDGYSMALSQAMPETYMIDGRLRFEENSGTAGILLRCAENGDTGYFLRFNLKGQRLEFGKIGGYRSWYVDHMPELDRPLAMKCGEDLRFKIIIDKTAVVAYVNDEVALSARAYSNPFGRCGLYVDGTAVSVSDFVVRMFNA
jgi:beta-fructofuranosidase